MMHPKFLPFSVQVDDLRRFAGDGVIYRAYEHLIAAKHGAVVLVPMIVMQGRFQNVVDGCPVPWEEIYSILEAPSVPFMMELVNMPIIEEELTNIAPLGLDPKLWEFDFIGIHDDTRRNILRFSHVSGVRYAVAARFVV